MEMSQLPLCILVENLGDSLPSAVYLNKCEEVGVIGTGSVLFHVDSDNGSGLGDSENVIAGFDTGSLAAVTDECVEIVDRTGKHIRLWGVDKAIHSGVLVKRFRDNIRVAEAKAFNVLIGSCDNRIILLCRDGLEICGHFLDKEVSKIPQSLSGKDRRMILVEVDSISRDSRMEWIRIVTTGKVMFITAKNRDFYYDFWFIVSVGDRMMEPSFTQYL